MKCILMLLMAGLVNGWATQSTHMYSKAPTYLSDVVFANDDIAHCYENGSVIMPVINNDFGLSEGIKSLTVVVMPAHGEVVVNDEYSILYTPDVSYFGEDILTYKVCNVDGSCSEAQVYISVFNVDFEPEAIDDTVHFVHESEITIAILENDLVAGDTPIEVEIIENVKNGYCELTDEYELIPEFNRKYVGKDSLTYRLCDADMDCVEAKVIFQVVHEGDIDFYIPNAMSPNGDGLNDTFRIPDFTNYTGISAQIMDRWGTMLYEDRDYPNNWNGIANTGRLKGQLVPPGTYYYLFTVPGVGKQLSGYLYISK